MGRNNNNNNNNNEGRSGRHGRGNDRGGRGRGRFPSKNNNNNNNNYEKQQEMKFYPHGSGKKGQTITFATVKDHIVSFVQHTYKHGKDIGKSLRDLEKYDLSNDHPIGAISIDADDEIRKLEQDGLDIIYQATIKQFLDLSLIHI